MFFRELNLNSFQVTDLPSLAAKWLNESKAAKKSPKTIRRRVTSIRTFGEQNGCPGLLVGYKMPALGLQVPHPLPGLRDDLDLLLYYAEEEEHKALLSLCGQMGLRVFEALNVRIEDINIRTMTLTVYGKGYKVRHLPINENAWRYIAPRYTYCVLYGITMLISFSDRGARNYITKLGERVGISRPISSHDLRATFATLSWARSKDIMALRIWMGHESIETTRMYVQVAEEALKLAGDI